MKIELSHPDFNNLLSRLKVGDIMQRTAAGAEEAIKEHYKNLPENWFDSTKASYPDGTSKHEGPRTFMRQLTRAWRAVDVSADGFALEFRNDSGERNMWGLRLQEYGGTITPKKVNALTIPMTAAARGVTAARFSQTIHELIPIGTTKPQGEKLGWLAWRDEDGGLHAAYALRSRSEVKPLLQRRGHHAIPTDYQLMRMVRPHFVAALERAWQNL